MPKESKEKGKMYEMYGNYVQVPYSWYGLCRKYIIPKEVKEFRNKAENCIELNPMEINVLAYLANYDECYVTNSTIAGVFNVRKQTIEKYMKELRWVGFIKTFENKDNPTYTDRRDIYVQHDVIKEVLQSESNPYIVPYECKVHYEHKVSYECNASTLQTNGDYPTDVMQVPYTCNTNKKELEYIKINKNTVASLQNASLDEIDFKCKLSCFTNESIKGIIDKKISECLERDYTTEYIIDYLVKDFNGAFYQCDKEPVRQYIEMKLQAS